MSLRLAPLFLPYAARRPVLRSALALLCALGAGGAALAADASSAWRGIVTHVTDGDTLWVRPESGGPVRKIRIEGIDAPEICQTYGETARRSLAGRVLGQPVWVRGRRVDDYGRLLARVHAHGGDVGAWLVARGHAWSYGGSRHARGPYATQQAQARAEGLGLWQQRAVSPRVFRRRHGSCH